MWSCDVYTGFHPSLTIQLINIYFVIVAIVFHNFVQIQNLYICFLLRRSLLYFMNRFWVKWLHSNKGNIKSKNIVEGEVELNYSRLTIVLLPFLINNERFKIFFMDSAFLLMLVIHNSGYLKMQFYQCKWCYFTDC